MIPLLRASHLQPVLAVTAITTVLAASVGRGTSTLWVALAVLAGQLTVGWTNDYLDRERDRRAGRLDKPIVACQVRAKTVGLAAVVAGGLCVWLSLLSGWRAALVHLSAVAAALAYNAGLKRTPASPLAYTWAFGCLPVFVTLGLPGHPLPPVWAPVAAALLGTGAHFVNASPDLAADLAAGVRGLPQRLGARRSLVAAGLLMGSAAAVAAAGPPGAPSALTTGLLGAVLASVGGVLVVAARGRGRGAWTLTLCTAGLSVAMLLTHGDALVA